jgi:hypothetical protein
MITKPFSIKILSFALLMAAMVGCDKKDKPALGAYPEDVDVIPTTPLRFFVSFDSTTPEAKQINIRFRDEISGYPSFFPDNSISYAEGVGGTGTSYVGTDSKNLVYYNTNDFVKSTSFSVAFWEKHDGVPVGDAQFAMSIPSTMGHWSNSAMLLIFDHTGAGATNDLAVIKLMVAEEGGGDHWFELTGGNRMPGIYDNQWHHLAFAYDEATSTMSFYKDGALFNTQSWAGHGALNLDETKVSGFYLGGKTTDWGKAFKGGLDQFRLYNKALTPAEVLDLFTTKK